MSKLQAQNCVLAILLAAHSSTLGETPPSARVSLTSFSSGGSSPTDQTSWIQRALEETSRKGQTLLIPRAAKPYQVRPIQIPTNAHVVLESGTVLQAAPGYTEFQRLLNIVDARNVQVEGSGATLRMAKSDYKTGEYRHCLYIAGSTGVTVRGVTCSEAGGDGFYISGSEKKPFSENLLVEEVKAEGSKRNGLTVISAKNLLVRRSTFARSTGVKPNTGIDLEPQSPADRLDAIRIEDNLTEENAGQGIRVAISKLTSKSYPVRVIISRHHDKKSGGSSLFATNETRGLRDVPGMVMIDHFSSESPRLYGILFSFWNSTGPKATVADAQILNANQARATDDNAAIGIIRGGGGTGCLGNIEFLRTSIRDTEKKPLIDHYFSFNDYSRKGFSKVAFSRPGILSGASRQHPFGLIQGQAVDTIDFANEASLAKLWRQSQATASRASAGSASTPF